MTQSTPAFSDRYLAQVEAERQFVVQQLQEVGADPNRQQGCCPSASCSIDVPLAAKMNHMPTLEEAYRAAYAANRRSSAR